MRIKTLLNSHLNVPNYISLCFLKNKIKNLYVRFYAFMLFRVLVAAPTKKKKSILVADYLKIGNQTPKNHPHQYTHQLTHTHTHLSYNGDLYLGIGNLMLGKRKVVT